MEGETPEISKTPKQLKKEQKAEKKAQKKQERREKHAKKWEKQTRLLFPANKKGLHKCAHFSFLRSLLSPLFKFVFPFKLYGHTKVGPGACIYFGNHYRMLDVFYPAQTTHEIIHFVAKQSILEAPVLGYYARIFGVIGAMRDGSDVRTVMDSMKVLKHGEKISLFPEGTRNLKSDDEFLPFHGGAAILAIKTQTPVIPFVICSRPRVFHRVHIVFGEPLELSEYYGRKLTSADYEEADEKLKQTLYNLRAEHRAFLAEKKAKKKGKA